VPARAAIGVDIFAPQIVSGVGLILAVAITIDRSEIPIVKCGTALTLVLYFGCDPPFAWRVMLALEHKPLADEARRLRFDRQETRSANFLAINPQGRVPTLVPDGSPLCASLTIMAYLEDAYPAPPLRPAAPRLRATAYGPSARRPRSQRATAGESRRSTPTWPPPRTARSSSRRSSGASVAVTS
jgi:hypothetical protein